MIELKLLISKQKLLLDQFLKTSEEIDLLDIDLEFDLLNQILKNREQLSKTLHSISLNIVEYKDSIGSILFSELIEENDNILKKILYLDKKNENLFNIKKDKLEVQMNQVSTQKDVINNYHMNKIDKPRLISQV